VKIREREREDVKELHKKIKGAEIAGLSRLSRCEQEPNFHLEPHIWLLNDIGSYWQPMCPGFEMSIKK